MHTKINNVELLESKNKNIPILSYPEYINILSENKHRIVIAGSHGKTTITSMVMHVLRDSNIKFGCPFSIMKQFRRSITSSIL